MNVQQKTAKQKKKLYYLDNPTRTLSLSLSPNEDNVQPHIEGTRDKKIQ